MLMSSLLVRDDKNAHFSKVLDYQVHRYNAPPNMARPYTEGQGRSNSPADVESLTT